MPLCRWFVAALAGLLLSASLVDARPATGEPGRRVVINTISLVTRLNEASGASTPVEIWYDRTDDNRLRLAFIEDEIDGFGEMWRAAAWQAVLLACDLTGSDLRGTRIYFQRSGSVDGPSAGGLTTIGVIAALRGDTLRSDVAMTGAINPDGTIGPVGGVAHKIDGAAAAGMKVVLIPYGMRTDRDENTKEDVDLFQRAESHGLELRPVGDVYTAYQVLTGNELPRPAPAPTPLLRNDLYQRTKIKADEWLVRYRDQVALYERVPDDFKSEFTEALIEVAAGVVEELDELYGQGQAPAAYSDALAAATYAAVANEVARTIWVDQKRGREEAAVYAQRFAQAPMKQRLAIQKLKAHKLRSLAGAGTTMYAYSAFTEGVCYQDLADLLLSGKRELPILVRLADDDDGDLERILEAVTFMQYAAYDYVLVSDTLEIAGEIEGRPLPDDAPLLATADFIRRTAQANLNQFERMIIDGRASSSGVTSDAMREKMLGDDESYLVAWWINNRTQFEVLKQFVDNDEQFALAQLGAAIYCYSLSSTLNARHYSLGAEMDEGGFITGVRMDAPLKYMLDFAEDQTRRNIQLLERADVDPANLVFNYMVAEVYRGREIADRLDALSWHWEANVIARTLAYLGGFEAGVEPTPVDAATAP